MRRNVVIAIVFSLFLSGCSGPGHVDSRTDSTGALLVALLVGAGVAVAVAH